MLVIKLVAGAWELCDGVCVTACVWIIRTEPRHGKCMKERRSGINKYLPNSKRSGFVNPYGTFKR